MRGHPWQAVLAAGLLSLTAGACAADSEPTEPVTDPARISISVEADAELVEASLGQLERADHDTLFHEVIVRWLGDSAATLDDARFAQHISDTNGDLVLSGRSCGADWDAQTGEVVHMCTADLLLVELGPNESHAYPVRIHPQVGPLSLAPGTYVVEQLIGWSQDGEQGEFTLQLTYEVE